MKIICVRHEQSETNVNAHWEGKKRLDPHLTPLGQSRAKRLQFECDLVILSNLTRTQETFQFSNMKTKDSVICSLFREWGNDWANFKHSEYNEVQTFETKLQLKKRVQKALSVLQEIANTVSSDFTIVIISHFDFLSHLSKLVKNKKQELRNGGHYTFVL